MSQRDSPRSSTNLAEEKVRADVQETAESPLYNAHIDVSGIDERKLMRKIDLRLIPWLSLLYLLSFLDRTSIGNAKVRDRCFFSGLSLHASRVDVDAR